MNQWIRARGSERGTWGTRLAYPQHHFIRKLCFKLVVCNQYLSLE